PYALKVFRSTWRDDGVQGAAFRREAALLAGVSHPGVVRIHEVGVAGGRPFLLMDLVEGDRLTDVLHAGPLPEDRPAAVVPAPDVHGSRPDLSPATAAVLRRLLAKDPDDRYQSATALVADLEWVAGELAAGRAPGELPARPEVPDAPAEIPLVGRVEEL